MLYLDVSFLLVIGSEQHYKLLYPRLRVSGTANIACVGLPSKRFRAVSQQRTRNESQRPRENGESKSAGMGGSRSIFRAAKTGSPAPRSSFVRKQTETLRRLQQIKRFSNISHGDHIVQTLGN